MNHSIVPGIGKTKSDILSKHQVFQIAANMYSKLIFVGTNSVEADPELNLHNFKDTPEEYSSIIAECLGVMRSVCSEYPKNGHSIDKIASNLIGFNIENLGLWCSSKCLQIEISIRESILQNTTSESSSDHLLRRLEYVLQDFIGKHPGMLLIVISSTGYFYNF
jgi:hypothetical protein